MRRRDQEWTTAADGFTLVSPTASRVRDFTLLVIVVAGLATWGFVHFMHLRAHVPSLRPTVIYGTGRTKVAGTQTPMTCTQITNKACVAWTVVSVDQRAVEAAPLPPGSQCSSAKADQSTGRWVCVTTP